MRLAYLFGKSCRTVDQSADSFIVTQLLDSPRDGGRHRVYDAWKVGRLLEGVHEAVVSEARIAVHNGIRLRYQLSLKPSRGSESMLWRTKIVGRSETMANISDQVAAVMSLTGDHAAFFRPAICFRISALNCIMFVRFTYFIATE
jgi:hypothetical protein